LDGLFLQAEEAVTTTTQGERSRGSVVRYYKSG